MEPLVPTGGASGAKKAPCDSETLEHVMVTAKDVRNCHHPFNTRELPEMAPKFVNRPITFDYESPIKWTCVGKVVSCRLDAATGDLVMECVVYGDTEAGTVLLAWIREGSALRLEYNYTLSAIQQQQLPSIESLMITEVTDPKAVATGTFGSRGGAS